MHPKTESITEDIINEFLGNVTAERTYDEKGTVYDYTYNDVCVKIYVSDDEVTSATPSILKSKVIEGVENYYHRFNFDSMCV